MAFTKFASFEVSEILGVKGSSTRAHTASLDKFSEFDDYRTQDGYLYARIRAISSRVNKNHDGWPSVELAGGPEIFERHLASQGGFTVEAKKGAEYGFSTFLGKPIFVDHHNHDPSRARGVIVDAKLHVEDSRTSSLDPYYATAPDNHKPPTWVELLLEVDAKSFPRLAKAIIDGAKDPGGGIDGFSMGCNVEMSKCSHCGNEASSPEYYCQHIRAKGAHFDYIEPNGRRVSKRSYEDCYGIQFFEISAVFDPADETALIREVRASVNKEGMDQKEREESATIVHPNEGEEGYHYPIPDEKHAEEALKLINSGDLSPSEKEKVRNRAEKMIGEKDSASFIQMPCPHCKGRGLIVLPNHAVQECAECGGTGIEGRNNLVLPKGYPEYGEGAQTPGRIGPMDTNLDPVSPATRGNNPAYSKTTAADGVFHIPAPEEVDQLARRIMVDEPGISPEEARRTAEIELENRFEIEPYTVNGEGESPQFKVKDSMPLPQGLPLGPVDRPRYQGSVHTAENPLPQSDLLHAPENINTLRDERVCPVCGNPNMDEDQCEVCGYQAEPEGFDNPDLTKAQETDIHRESIPAKIEQENSELQDQTVPVGQQPPPPRNVPMTSHVNGDMARWTVITPKVSGRINSVERPIRPGTTPATNEPKEQIISDQLKPVTSNVRTASEFIAAAGRNSGENNMKTADAASGAPEAATPDERVDVTGVGGVLDASNESASQADGQVDVTAVGGTGVEGVEADSHQSIEETSDNAGFDTSKQIEAIPTKTWGQGSGVEHQEDPVSSEPFPASDEGVKQSNDSGAFPKDDGGLAGGSAVQGVKPVAEQFGERVDVLDAVTSPSNNSGPTKTWSGTEGNGVIKQQDPVTKDTLEGNDIVNLTKGSSAHLFAAFKLADLEVELGLTPKERKFARVAELENEEPTIVVASLKYAQRVKTAGLGKARTAGVTRVPSLGRNASVQKEAEVSTDASGDEVLFL